MGRLVLRKTMAVAATVCLVLSTLFCVTGCSDNDDENVTEFRATDLAEYTGDSFTERFLLNSDKGTYQRYIGGIYKGETRMLVQPLVRCTRRGATPKAIALRFAPRSGITFQRGSWKI